MATLLRAADVVVGKPGGLTVSESLACGRPFFATCSLGGQEGHNVDFLEKHGAGKRIEIADLPRTLHELFADEHQLKTMKKCAEKQGHRYAARNVLTEIEDALRNRNFPLPTLARG